MTRFYCVAIALTLAVATASARAASADAGQQIFARCKICHTVAKGGETLLGPNLHGLFGRKAGSLPDYDYSRAMRRSGIVWNDSTLAKFLRDPNGYVHGTRMGFPGVKNEDDLENLLRYLKQATR